ncbi:MAG: site-specific integrase, partial [Bdellovibrionales bacterium]
FYKESKKYDYQTQFIVMCGLFLGLRKSEILGLQFKDFDLVNKVVLISRKIESASLSVKVGTKAGEYECRTVPIPKECASEFNKVLKALGGSLFVLKGVDRPFMSPRTLHTKISLVANNLNLKVSSHKLRHTFGREFISSGGSLKLLQSILGHSSSSVTDRYSDLDGSHIEGASDSVSYRVKSEAQQ